MILLIIFALLMQSMVIVQRIASASHLEGRVEVQRGGEGDFKPLQKGDFVKTKDVVRTGAKGSAEFSWADGTRWKLMPASQLTVKKATFNAVRKTEQNQLQLSAGKVFIRIMKALAPSSKFEVETPTAVAAVRGTIFSVEVSGDQTKVCVYKGHVKVTEPRVPGENAPGTVIEPGEVAIAAPGQVRSTLSDSAAAFLQQPDILHPQLTTSTLPLKGNKSAIIKGKTEVGDTLTINGRQAEVLGNGSFYERFTLSPGPNNFTNVTRDKHGQETKKIETLQGPVAP
jgi:hypothetical protein